MSTVFISPNWRMPRNANQSKQSNSSMDFDGSSEYINAGSTPQALVGNNSAYTVSAWVNPDTSGNSNIIGAMDTSNRWYFRVLNGYASYAYGTATGDNGYNTAALTGVSLNTWSHIMFTFDGSTTHKIYINGDLKLTQSSGSGQTVTSTRDLYIGALNNNGSTQNYFNGQIDGVAIYNYALSQSQVTTLYGDSTSGPGNPMALPRTPIAYYPLGTSAWNGDYLVENNAIGDYVFDFPATDAIQSDFTLFNGASEACISAWFKTSTQQSGKCLFSSPFSTGGNRFDLYLQTNGLSSYLKTVTNVSNIASSTINYYDDKWHNVIVTYDGVNHKIYYDGDEVATASRSGVLATSTYNKLEIGRFGTSHSNNVNAEMSNVLVWTKGLTSTEAETLYNYGSPIQTLANIPQNSNLKAWYKLDSSDVYDSSTTEWNNIEARANNKGSMLTGYNAWSGNALLQSYNSPVERSISIWVRRTAAMGYHGCCNQQGVGGAQAYSIFFVWSNRGHMFSFFVPSPNKFVDFGYMAPETWYHAVLTDTGVTAAGRFKTYWNGEFANASTDLTYDLGTPTNGFKWAGGNFLWAPGSIADGRIFDTVLSASEVKTLYNNGAPSTLNNVKPNNLKQWLTFENIDTSVGGGLYDKSGNNNQLNTPLYPWVAARAAENLNVPISALNGLSSGMNQSNLVQSDLQTVAPYSKYAMNFDGTDYIETNGNVGINIGNTFTASAWVNLTGFGGAIFGGTDYVMFIVNSGEVRIKFYGYYHIYSSLTTTLSTGTWYHFLFVRTGETGELFINGVSQGPASNLGTNNFQFKYIGTRTTSTQLFNGKISNAVVWNTALSISEVREVYNQGLPSNLHNFSGTAPVAWWQLGENSSYVSGWTFADEIGSNNGTSGNLPETALTNGVGTTANGVSNGMAVEALVSDAPYSTGNAMSVNMSSAAKGSNTP